MSTFLLASQTLAQLRTTGSPILHEISIPDAPRVQNIVQGLSIVQEILS